MITNRRTLPVKGSDGLDRTRYRPKLTKDAMGNDVRIMVPVK